MSLEVLTRQQGDQLQLLVITGNGRAPTAQQCEDAGEDHGFYEPVVTDAQGLDGCKNIRVVVEGFKGELCDHEWGIWGRYSRNPFGSFARCKKCQVFVSTAQKKRSDHIDYTYDEWTLRHHIWQRWLKRGPVPGSLAVQAHHQKGGTL